MRAEGLIVSPTFHVYTYKCSRTNIAWPKNNAITRKADYCLLRLCRHLVTLGSWSFSYVCPPPCINYSFSFFLSEKISILYHHPRSPFLPPSQPSIHPSPFGQPLLIKAIEARWVVSASPPFSLNSLSLSLFPPRLLPPSPGYFFILIT